MQYTHEERSEQILDVLARVDWLPMREIANRVGLRKSPYLRDLVQELVIDGLVGCRQETMTNGLPINIYFMTDEGREYASFHFGELVTD